MTTLWDSRRKALAAYLEKEELITWTLQQLRHHKEDIDALHIRNGALLCSLLAHKHPSFVPAIDLEATTDAANVKNYKMFLDGMKSIMERALDENLDAKAVMKTRIMALETQLDKQITTDVIEGMFELLKDMHAASVFPPPTPITKPPPPSSSSSSSGIPRLLTSTKPSDGHSKIPRLDKENVSYNTSKILAPKTHWRKKRPLEEVMTSPHGKKPRLPSPTVEPDVSTPSSNVPEKEASIGTETPLSSQPEEVVASIAMDDTLGQAKEIYVARCVHDDLRRDNARMKLKIEYLRDEIQFQYELLAHMEQVALHAIEPQQTDESDKSRATLELAQAIQRIISAPPDA